MKLLPLIALYITRVLSASFDPKNFNNPNPFIYDYIEDAEEGDGVVVEFNGNATIDDIINRHEEGISAEAKSSSLILEEEKGNFQYLRPDEVNLPTIGLSTDNNLWARRRINGNGLLYQSFDYASSVKSSSESSNSSSESSKSSRDSDSDISTILEGLHDDSEYDLYVKRSKNFVIFYSKPSKKQVRLQEDLIGDHKCF